MIDVAVNLVVRFRNQEALERYCRAIDLLRDAAEDMPWQTDMVEALDELSDIKALFVVRAEE